MFECREGYKVTGITIKHKNHYGFIKYVKVNTDSSYLNCRNEANQQECAVFILRTVFDKWMKELGYSNVENILHEWRDRYGFLVVKDNTRINCKVRVSDGQKSQQCIGIKMPMMTEAAAEDEDTDENKKESVSETVIDKIRELMNSKISDEYINYVEEMITQCPKELINQYITLDIKTDEIEKYIKEQIEIENGSDDANV
jgi:hypothetical protein